MHYRFIWALLLISYVIQPAFGQIPKREFRGVWVSTVANIDWPSRPALSSEDQKQEILRILDRHKENGINAIILQVRPTADAIYPSELEPWSRFLTGEQGRELDYQIWCGPAMGAFNAWVRNSYLADINNRRVADVARHIMTGASYLYRIQNLEMQGIKFPPEFTDYRPQPFTA